MKWVDARTRLPRDRTAVLGATTGRYPGEPSSDPDSADGLDFWLVLPMYFLTYYVNKDGTEYHNCFVDTDSVVRLPYGRPCAEAVTHWTELPTLPGTNVHQVLGDGVRAALSKALGASGPLKRLADGDSPL
jgi:hypothetical protein